MEIKPTKSKVKTILVIKIGRLIANRAIFMLDETSSLYGKYHEK